MGIMDKFRFLGLGRNQMFLNQTLIQLHRILVGKGVDDVADKRLVPTLHMKINGCHSLSQSSARLKGW